MVVTFQPTTFSMLHKENGKPKFSRKGSKSMVYNYFRLQANENWVLQEMEDKPVCDKKVYAWNLRIPLTHLWDHHADLYAEASQGLQGKGGSSKQPSLHETVELYSSHSAKATTLNKAVAYFSAKDMQPMYTIEEWFQSPCL